jgi:hypothetical protein
MAPSSYIEHKTRTRLASWGGFFVAQMPARVVGELHGCQSSRINSSLILSRMPTRAAENSADQPFQPPTRLSLNLPGVRQFYSDPE